MIEWAKKEVKDYAADVSVGDDGGVYVDFKGRGFMRRLRVVPDAQHPDGMRLAYTFADGHVSTICDTFDRIGDFNDKSNRRNAEPAQLVVAVELSRQTAELDRLSIAIENLESETSDSLERIAGALEQLVDHFTDPQGLREKAEPKEIRQFVLDKKV